ncbi:MAG: hypothetical protein ACRD6Q_03030 [Nitrososphaeraceae archaeon]
MQIRQVILKCGLNFQEFYPISNEYDLRYYSNPENKFVELKMREEYLEEEIELLCPQIGISLEEFKELNRRARKHKL